MQLEMPTERDVDTLERWLQEPECRKRLGGVLPLRPFLEHVRSQRDYWLWVAHENGTPVALTGFEITATYEATVLLVVDPAKRNLGFGRRVLRLLMGHPEAGRVRQFVASVEADNEPALRCFEAVGFASGGLAPAEPGFRRLALSPVPQTEGDTRP